MSADILHWTRLYD